MTREMRLAGTFVELADTLVENFDIVVFLEVFARRCVELLDVAAAGIILADGLAGGQVGALTAVAASDERSQLLGLFAVQADEGPGHECCRDGIADAGVVLDRAHGRWPTFSPQAVAIGFRAVDSLPLRRRHLVIGSLTLFHAAPAGLDDAGLRMGQALADAATIGILQQRTLRHAEIAAAQLEAALASRIMIEQAKGALAERLKIAPEDAFNILRSAARNRNLRLSDLAADIVSGAGKWPCVNG